MSTKNIIQKKILAIKKKREEILVLSADDAIDEILNFENMPALIRSIDPYDFYFLMNEADEENFAPILREASIEQIEHIIDFSIWDRDKIKIKSLSKLVASFIKLKTDEFSNFLINEEDLLQYFLHKNIEVIIREENQDPSEIPEDYFSLDDTFYIKVANEDMQEAVGIILQKYLKENFLAYQQLLNVSPFILATELEEEMYRKKNMRLCEKGFLPFEEAISIYSYTKKEDIREKEKNLKESDSLLNFYNTRQVIKNLAPLKVDEKSLSDDAIVDLTMLLNQICIAEGKEIKDRNILNQNAKKLCNFLEIGIIYLKETRSDLTSKDNQYFIENFYAKDIFSFAWSLILDIKHKVERWHKQSFFKSKKLSLHFWKEDYFGTIGGLLLKRPMFFDNYQSSVSAYKNFENISQIRITEEKVNKIIILDKIFSLVDIKFSLPKDISFDEFIFTLWARYNIGLKDDSPYITLDNLKTFLSQLFDKNKKIKDKMKEDFRKFLYEKTAIDLFGKSHILGQIFEELFFELENEYANVKIKNLNPNYVKMFYLKKQEEHHES